MKTKHYRIPILLLITCLLILCVTVGASAADETTITLSDDAILVDGQAASTDASSAVYTGAAIVYYMAGQGSDYGEGTEADEHEASESSAHTVVTITEPGTYRLSGSLSAGQISIDLGENAAENSNNKVELILDNVDITCTVAPAIIFYNVYESDSVDSAGALVTIADDSENTVNGSYVARIYKEGTTDKLHKYDGAFYSKMTMLVQGETKDNGKLTIEAENEGLDSERHLTINGGNIYITADNDGINANEDNVSIVTINGGFLHVSGGYGEEGDGIDSNGYLTINGGTLIAYANERAGEGGIDADLDITINGGTVVALSSRNDVVASSSAQPYMELTYATQQAAKTMIHLTDANGTEILSFSPLRAYQSVTISTSDMANDTTYYLYAGGSISGTTASDGLYAIGGTYANGTQQQHGGSNTGGPGGQGPGNGQPPNGEMPEGMEPPTGEMPNGEQPPEGEMPENWTPPEGDGTAPPDKGNQGATTEVSTDFTIIATNHSFYNVAAIGSNWPFTDVTQDDSVDWFYSAVKFVYERGWMVGTDTTTFAPNTSLNRAMMVTILQRVAGEESQADDAALAASSFDDVSESDWYAAVLGWALRNDLITGYGDGNVGPLDSIERQDFCVLLFRFAESRGIDLSTGNAEVTFTDASAIEDYAAEAVATCTTATIIKGYEDGSFLPANALTRAEAATMCMRFAEWL